MSDKNFNLSREKVRIWGGEIEKFSGRRGGRVNEDSWMVLRECQTPRHYWMAKIDKNLKRKLI